MGKRILIVDETKYVNPFIEAAMNVVEQITGVEVRCGHIPTFHSRKSLPKEWKWLWRNSGPETVDKSFEIPVCAWLVEEGADKVSSGATHRRCRCICE